MTPRHHVTPIDPTSLPSQAFDRRDGSRSRACAGCRSASRSIATCAVVLSSVGLARAAPSAAPLPPVEASTEVGAGIYLAQGEGPAALVKVSLEVDAPPNLPLPVTSLCPRTRGGLGVECGTNQDRYARLDAIGAVSAVRGTPIVPYLDIHFYPKEIEAYLPVPTESENAFILGLAFLPVRFARNTAIDESFDLSVAVAALHSQDWWTVGSHFTLFADLTLEGFGYKSVRYLSSAGPFDGLLVWGGDLRFGAAWTGTPNLTLRVSPTGSMDYSQWTRAQLDASLGGLATADISTFLRLFVQPRYVWQENRDGAWTEDRQLLGGVSFAF